MSSGNPEQDRAQALNWLKENFGLNQDELVGEAVTIMCTRTNEGNLSAYLVDKQGKQWRISEVLAAFAAEEVALAVAEETERCAKIAESAIGATRHEIAEEIRGGR